MKTSLLRDFLDYEKSTYDNEITKALISSSKKGLITTTREEQ